MRKLFILCLLGVLSIQLIAQDASKKEEIQALRKAYIKDKLELTDTQSNDLFELIRAFEKEQKALKTTFVEKYRKGKKLSEASEQQANDFLEAKLDLEADQLAVKRKYLKKMQTVIPTKKLLRLERVNKTFRRKVVEKMKTKRGQRDRQ